MLYKIHVHVLYVHVLIVRFSPLIHCSCPLSYIIIYMYMYACTVHVVEKSRICL